MADTGFRIDGLVYDVPTLDSFNMDEAEILYKTSGLALEDFAVDEDDPEASARFQRNLRNPGFIRAMMTVAYIRGNPGMSVGKASAVIGKANLIEAVQNFIEAGSDESPPDQTLSGNGQPDSGASTESSSAPSGWSSTDSSAAPGDPPVATGTSE